MRHISFSHTTEQMRAKTKTVTRRLRWATLKAGETLMAAEKIMGLPKGAKIATIGPIEIISVRTEPLETVLQEGPAGMAREGFPGMSPAEYVAFFCKANRCPPSAIIRRIEFRPLY